MPPPNTPEEFFEEEYRQRRNSAVAYAARRQHFNLTPHDEDDGEDEFELNFGVHLAGSQNGPNEDAEDQQTATSHILRLRTSLDQDHTHSPSRTSSRSHSPHRARNQRDNALTRSMSPSTAAPTPALAQQTASPLQHQAASQAVQTTQSIPSGFFFEHGVVGGIDLPGNNDEGTDPSGDRGAEAHVDFEANGYEEVEVGVPLNPDETPTTEEAGPSQPRRSP